MDESGGDGEAALHSAGERAEWGRGSVGEIEGREELFSSGSADCAGEAVELGEVFEISSAGEFGVEI